MRLLHTLLHRWDNNGSLRRQSPPAPHPSQPSAFTHPFDQTHGTDTGGYLPGASLARAPLTPLHPDFYNTAYYAISPSTLRQALAHLPQPPSAFTFVDIGCGKGRALLVAAELPFAALLGVELNPQLAQTAARNTQSDPRISILTQDAASTVFPPAPLVVFLYHPFLAPVLRRLLTALRRHHRAHLHPIYLLYANPSYFRLLARFPFLQPVWDYVFPLSPEDAQADRHGITVERFTLHRADPLS